MALTGRDFISSHDSTELWEVIIAVLMTGYGSMFMLRSRSDLGFDDTMDYMKEAIQFRRSGQSRLDLVTLIRQRQKRRITPVSRTDPAALQRVHLQASLNKEKELDAQLAMLREGVMLDISELWQPQKKIHARNSFFDNVEEARIEPNRKRLSLILNFPDLNEDLLKDDMTMVRFNRQVYDFFQSLNTESWLKPYAPFYESYFLLCRAARVTKNHAQLFYPFMKAGILVSELRKLEGFYFNPRKLSEIATVAFNNGAQV